MAIKYLVINHEETANLKTVIAYDVPPAPLGVGYLNFDDADGDANTSDISVVATPVSGTLLFAENDGFAQTQYLVYSGNISHPDQNTTGTQGYNILDIRQNGQQFSQGKI